MSDKVVGFGLLFLACASCSPSPQSGGGIGGTGSVATVASGPVTKFGSVFVSGTEYDNSNTIYCIDDDPCSHQNNLKIGMVVLVNGRVTEEYSSNTALTRIADTITFEETVEGAVQSVAPDGLSLVVLGQIVRINQTTVIDPSVPGQALGNLRPGLDVVEVSGFVTGDGQILATLIMMQAGAPHYEIQGSVKNHNVQDRTFEIGALIVDYASADIGQMPSPASSSWNGIVVHVRGNQWSSGGPGPYGARLTATKVVSPGLGVEDGAEAEVEGFILQVIGPGDVVVNNQRIRTSSSTAFEGGTSNDLVVGAHVEVHGRLAADLLEAEEVSFKGEIELESNVASIDSGSSALTLTGLAGLTILVDNKTAIGGAGNLRRFEDIRVGDHLKIHGRLSGNSGLLVKELERSGSSAQVKLEGPVRSASDPVLVIAGASIDTSDISSNSFIDGNGYGIGRTTFFRDLAIGQEVSLKGTWTGSEIVWTSARRSNRG